MTANPRSEFLAVMRARGFIADCTDQSSLDHDLTATTVHGYIGFDATAPSLHVGSLVQIMMLRWLQRTGGRPIVLMGGGTTRIGDPSFRAEERPMLDGTAIASNLAGIRGVFSRYLDFSSGGAIMIDNAEWLDSLELIPFLREVGRHFSINRMLALESVKSRLDREQSLSFLEFNYMILQAYDYLQLHRRFGCRLQMGGSDQWGNIVSGVDLVRRVAAQRVHGLTSPLLTTADGKKMGKTATGAVWLNEESLPAYEFWQYWRNVDDADVGRFLKLFTEIEMTECERLAALKGSEVNEAKITLANAVTALAHGKEAADAAQNAARSLFVDGHKDADLPRIHITGDEVTRDGLPIVRALILAGLASSGKSAKRLIQDRGARLDGVTIDEPSYMISHQSLTKGALLSAGRKRHVQIALTR